MSKPDVGWALMNPFTDTTCYYNKHQNTPSFFEHHILIVVPNVCLHSPNLSKFNPPLPPLFSPDGINIDLLFFAFLLRWGIMEYGWRALRSNAGVVMIESIQIPENLLSV